MLVLLNRVEKLMSVQKEIKEGILTEFRGTSGRIPGGAAQWSLPETHQIPLPGVL